MINRDELQDFQDQVDASYDAYNDKRPFAKRKRVKRNLSDRLQEAIVSNDRAEQNRLMRLMRNIEELKKAKRRPYKSGSVIEQLEARIARDQAIDPLRDVINKTFSLEVDPMYGLNRSGRSRIDADIENEFTARRVASGKTARLLDMPTERFPVSFRPVSKEQKRQARVRRQQARDLDVASRNFLNDVMRDSGTGMGVPSNLKVGKKIPPMIEGMEKTGLNPGSNQRASAVKQAIANLEVDSLGIANPPDELTRVSVAEGRTNLLGKLNVTLPYDAMPVTPAGNFLMFPRGERHLLPKGVEGPVLDDDMGNAFRREQLAERMKRKSIFQMYEDERLFKLSHSALDLFANPDYTTVNTGRGLPSMLEGMDYSDKLYQPDPAQFTQRLDYTQRYQGSIVAQKNQQKAIARAQSEAAAAARQSRVSSSMADNIAQDTMRAASVIHSSKLGFAAIGASAIGAAFGISSLRNKKEQRRTELERR